MKIFNSFRCSIPSKLEALFSQIFNKFISSLLIISCFYHSTQSWIARHSSAYLFFSKFEFKGSDEAWGEAIMKYIFVQLSPFIWYHLFQSFEKWKVFQTWLVLPGSSIWIIRLKSNSFNPSMVRYNCDENVNSTHNFKRSTKNS